jgi:light-independent protochlorophyllide reductase subunit B
VVPIGVNATRDFIAEVSRLAGLDSPALPLSADEGLPAMRGASLNASDSLAPLTPSHSPWERGPDAPSAPQIGGNGQAGGLASVEGEQSRLPWYSRSVDSTYLTGKRAFIFGDATHALAAARIATEELGFAIAGLGTYSREFAREVRAAAQAHGIEALITDDYLAVEQAIVEAQPELVLGTQMERHIAKRLGIPCAVISAPVHVQDFPARYSPQMGFEGANVIFDSWVHPLVMGLEEHLLTLFRDDPEFHDEAKASHLASETAHPQHAAAEDPAPSIGWSPDAETELRKVPFFVRGKARRNTETYARQQGVGTISVETLYDAKAHFGR